MANLFIRGKARKLTGPNFITNRVYRGATFLRFMFPQKRPEKNLNLIELVLSKEIPLKILSYHGPYNINVKNTRS
jgi:hypothetical protein